MLVSLLCLLMVPKGAEPTPGAAPATPMLVALANADPESSEEDLVKMIEDVERKMSPRGGNLRSFPEDVQGFPEVETTIGKLIGQTNSHSHSFYSVPYAESPEGEFRFMPPRPKVKFDSMNVSLPQSISCYQKCSSDCGTNVQEDCLVMNIYVPNDVKLEDHASDDSTANKIPVMFFIHGGGFQIGTANDDTFDSRLFVEYTNTIVVVVNYRLGPLGFMVYEEDGVKFEGNQGLKDQQLALKWVQDNIGKFGGDKSEVTVFGQSAGAQSVIFHLLSPESNKFFSRGLPQSPPMVFQYDTPEESINSTNYLIDILSRGTSNPNCSRTHTGLECLRNSDAQAVMGAATNVQVNAFRERDVFGLVEPFRPVIDGVEFTDQPMELFQDGKWNNEKTIMIGSTTDELAQTIKIFEGHKTSWRLFSLLNQVALGDDLGNIVAEKYGQRGDKDDADFDWTRIMTDELNDLFFTCPIRLMSRFVAKDYPIYKYIYDHGGKDSTCDDEGFTYYPCGYAAHATELTFEFRTGPSKGITWNDTDYDVSDMMDDYWGSFAHDDKPSSPNYHSFPLYQQDAEGKWPNLWISPPPNKVEYDYLKDTCEFWDSLDYYVVLDNKPTSTSNPTDSTSNPTDSDNDNYGGGSPSIGSSFVLVVSLLSAAVALAL